jgi:site-specific DNA-methyltransferase (adenine-specific)
MKLLLGDCLERLKEIEDKSIDFILTDPPYELDNHGGGQNKDLHRSLTDKHIDFISDGFDIELVFAQFERVMKVVNTCIFCSNKQVSKIMSYWESRGYSTTCLIWKKPNPIPFGNGKYVSDIEFIIYVRGKGATYNNLGMKEQSKVFEYSSPSSKKRIHPTEKPVELLEKLIRIHSKPGDVILDPFGGSGSTGEAALNNQRDIIIIEKNEDYFEGLKNRLEKYKFFSFDLEK